ncbi:MAG: CRISPR-associated endoribonuclease Cas6 [Synergistes sp.]|nr:CRISPR-associated endoribonuclease Cas6 [Synergistes sp.]
MRREYLHFIQAFVYKLMPPDDAAFIHDCGYAVGEKHMKLFSFSRPMPQSGEPKLEGPYIKFPFPAWLVITTPFEKTAEYMAESALSETFKRIDTNVVKCEEVRCMQYEAESSEITVNTLSPVTCYTTEYSADGKKYTRYFSPDEAEFISSAGANLKRKFQALYPDEPLPEGNVVIKPLDNIRQHTLKFRPGDSFPIKAWSGSFRMSGPRALLQTAIDCGIGAKNSIGLGCIIPEE